MSKALHKSFKRPPLILFVPDTGTCATSYTAATSPAGARVRTLPSEGFRAHMDAYASTLF